MRPLARLIGSLQIFIYRGGREGGTRRKAPKAFRSPTRASQSLQSLPKVRSSASKFAPSASKLVPRAPKVTPSAPKLTPS